MPDADSAAAHVLAGTGVRALRPVYANLVRPALVAHALRRGEGRLAASGALIVATGVHTGRSVQDKFVVDEPSVRDEIWWGKVNQGLDSGHFAVLAGRVRVSARPGAVRPGPSYWRRPGAPAARAAGKHRRLAGTLFTQRVHPPNRSRACRIRTRLRHPACAVVPVRSGDRRRARRHRHCAVV